MSRSGATPPDVRRVLCLGALPALAAASWALFHEGGAWPRTLLGLLLLAAPFLEQRLLRRWPREALLVALLVQLAGVALLQARAASLWSAATCQALARSRAPGAAALGGLLALGTAVVALRAVPSPWTMLAPFAVSLGVLPGLLALASHAARARALRAGLPPPAPDAQAGGAWHAALLAWPALFAGLALSAHLTSPARGTSSGTSARAEAAEGGALAGPSAAEPGVLQWSERISFGEGVGRLSEEIVLWAMPDARPRGSLYLAVLALDHFDERGLGQPGLARLRAVADADDGRADGWIEFARGAAASALEVRIAQRPLRVGRLGGDALVRIEPLLALELPLVLYERDTALVLPGEREGFFAYTFQAEHPDLRREPPPAARAVHPDPRYTELPRASPALSRLRTRSAALLEDEAGDPARVRRLLEHFEREFSYSLEGSGFAGVDGALAFLEQRAGYCTSFASTAVLLLRSQGIACRAVGGYLAHEWDGERGAFAVRGRNAHAWIEVHFEGLGWHAFDPTPSAERERAFLRSEGLLPPELSEWSDALFAALGETVDGSAGAAGFARLGARLAEAPAVLRQELSELAPAGRGALAALAVVGAAAAWLLRRAAEPAAAGAPARGLLARLVRGPYARLLELLEARGWSPAPAESLRVFARRVEASGVLAGFAAATELHLAERFGGAAPDAAARRRLEALLDVARRDRGTRA